MEARRIELLTSYNYYQSLTVVHGQRSKIHIWKKERSTALRHVVLLLPSWNKSYQFWWLSYLHLVFLPSLSILSTCLSSPQGKSANEISSVRGELLETEPIVKGWRAFGYIQSYFLSFFYFTWTAMFSISFLEAQCQLIFQSNWTTTPIMQSEIREK